MREQLTQLLKNSDLSDDELHRALAQLMGGGVGPTCDVLVDLGRAQRCGFPEVVYSPHKDPQAIVDVWKEQQAAGQNSLATRISDAQVLELKKAFPGLRHNSLARTALLKANISDSGHCRNRHTGVLVITAGSGDRAVAEEVLETLYWMDCSAELLIDVGVAGPQRLLAVVPQLQQARVIVVVAGMEGALPSVVAGWVSVPVIAVPTSVGYGANFQGMSALLSMINSCASNVAVVNIDAGFKAGYIAGLIAVSKY